MASEETTTAVEADQLSFKVKTSNNDNHSITISSTASVLDLKNKLSGDDFEKVPVDRQRLIYSGRVMKNEDPLSKYNIKPGNTIHMVKSAASNVTQAPPVATATGGGTPRAAAGVPTNMAAGTANNPLAGLTGARYAGHMALPGAEMFGADGGMGAPPSEDAMARMLEDPNVQQQLNEALSNPAVVDMMLQQMPGLRDNPQARQMFNDPEFRRMMTSPEAIRQASRMRRIMGGDAGAGAFPAPGVTDTTPGAGAANARQAPANPFAMFGAPPGGAAGANPFAALMGGGMFGATPSQTPPSAGSAGGGTPAANADNSGAANPFASLFGGPGGGVNPFANMPPPTPEQIQQAMATLNNQGGFGSLFGGGGLGGAASPPPPADTRPPEEIYADQLRQLNDMGFFDFDRNVAALRRSGGSVQGAIEQLLS